MRLLNVLFLCLVMAVVALGQDKSSEQVSKNPVAVFITTPPAAMPAGATITVPVWVTAQNGNVNAFSGSVAFDPSTMVYAGYYVIQTGGTYFPAEQEIAEGKLGHLFGVPAGTAFPAGTNAAFYLYFRTLKPGLPVVSTNGAPVSQEVSDPGAKKVDADFASIPSPTAIFFAGPTTSLNKLVTISVVQSSYPVTVWRVDYDGSVVQVDKCIALPNNGSKCTDEPKGGGPVRYYLEWKVPYGKLRSLPTAAVVR